jgi:hypothetical protein
MALSTGRYRIKQVDSGKYVTLSTLAVDAPFTLKARSVGNTANQQVVSKIFQIVTKHTYFEKFDITASTDGYKIKSVAYPEMYAAARDKEKASVVSKKSTDARWQVIPIDGDVYQYVPLFRIHTKSDEMAYQNQNLG